ncbi:hypothetical protein EGW08_021838 [Elysia chlorotica]|uniref:Mannosyltransferase n=1 Tax=Elysia chlorotica TaxID=188477 RepID=A0A433SMK5_ELYCH|nr:hypothetical protein EGW08_021838 [Elysia chlorotica]
MLGLDSRFLLIKLPRLVQAFIAAWGDLHLYKLSSQLAGRSTAQWTLLCQLMSWFTIYCCTRTLSNSTETSLIIIALSYFPWPYLESQKGNLRLFLLFASLSVIVRPTAALVWILLCCWHLQWVRYTQHLWSTVKTYLVVGLSAIGISAMVDRIWYGQWTFVQLNFLWFNVVRGGASIYGTHPWHWYLWQGFPVVMGTLIFPFVMGAWYAKDKTLLWIIAFIVATHSFLPHKEFRFIFPSVPLAMHYCGLYFQQLCAQPSLRDIKAKHRASSSNKARVFTAILALTNLLLAFYFCLIHQRGTIMVTKFLADAAESSPQKTDILFLMPCHSTPYYSYIHANVSMRFLTCEPQSVASSQHHPHSAPSPATWTDEADQFFESPEPWLKRQYGGSRGRPWPSHLVFFSTLHRDISALLVQAGYKMCGSFFHTHFADGRVSGSVLVSCRSIYASKI